MIDIKDNNGKVLMSVEKPDEANLQGADLRWANLQRADLQWADLRWADLRGIKADGSVISIGGLIWEVYISYRNIQIGCQSHSLTEWENFPNDVINDMHKDALDFWKENKDFILGKCRKITSNWGKK